MSDDTNRPNERPEAERREPERRDVAPGAAGSHLRAGNADRDRVAEILGAALSEGRLDVAEYSERMDVLYRSRTLGELEALTEDLPSTTLRAADAAAPRPANAAAAAAPYATGAFGADAAAAGPTPAVAMFSKVRRHLEGELPPRIEATSLFGALTVDLSGAEFPAGETTVEAEALFGKIVILVPDNARVEDQGAALFGKRAVPSNGEATRGGPTVRIRGSALFGKVTVWRSGRG